MTTLNQLQGELASMLDPLDIPGDWTPRQRDDYEARRGTLRQRISAIGEATATLADVSAQIAADTAWLAHLHEWRATLPDELLAIPFPIRDKLAKERADNLTWSIRVVDVGLSASTLGPVVTLAARIGELMREAGYATEAPALYGPHGWLGTQGDVEHRMKALQRRLAEAQAQLAEALLSDDERAARDAERAALGATLATMVIRHDSDGTGLVAFTPDGDPLPVDAMTDAQREAFSRL